MAVCGFGGAAFTFNVWVVLLRPLLGVLGFTLV